MFKEIKACKRSVSKRRLVFGVGINDCDYIVTSHDGKKKTMCPYYTVWTNMLRRCYRPEYIEAHPSYKGCAVCNDWLVFTNFKGWMIRQDWINKQIDKDLLIQGNKVYSPGTCLFVEQNINTLLNGRLAKRGDHPRGVSFCKRGKKFRSQCKVNGKMVFLGFFNTAKEAHEKYKECKYQAIKDAALSQDEPLRSALLRYKII